ncbi:MAG TPA: hypothetical protein VH328_00530, partial [Burkholderiaceae bacterium]|nr:hypothetical protein [Burkholderiaceae bacterium]
MRQPARTLTALAIAAACALFANGSAHAADAAPAPASAASGNAVRPEFGTPFNAAQAAIKAGDAQTSLAKIKEAEAVGNLSPYETYLVERIRGPALYTAGDLPGAEKDLEAVLVSSLLPESDRLPVMKVLATIYYSDKKYDPAVDYMQKYLAGGGDDAQIKEMLAQSLYLGKHYPEAAKQYQAMVDAQIAAGRKPDAKTLRLLASAQDQAADEAGYEGTIEKLAVMYPSPEYWKQVIASAKRPPFDEHLYVDVYRLRTAALGQVPDAEKLSYAGQAARVGYPAEALAVLDQGMAKNAFTGADAAEAKKLRDTVSRGAQGDRTQEAS